MLHFGGGGRGGGERSLLFPFISFVQFSRSVSKQGTLRSTGDFRKLCSAVGFTF